MRGRDLISGIGRPSARVGRQAAEEAPYVGEHELEGNASLPGDEPSWGCYEM